MSKLIGIGGVSRSGKSVLAEQIKLYFASKKVLILSQDEFVKEEKDIPKVRDRTDWEHPDSIDVVRLVRTIEENENSIDLIIVEGLLAFYFPKLDQLYDHRIIINISKETFLSRRKKEPRWGQEPEWFWEHVWDSYLKYGTSSNILTKEFSGEESFDTTQLAELIISLDQTNP